MHQFNIYDFIDVNEHFSVNQGIQQNTVLRQPSTGDGDLLTFTGQSSCGRPHKPMAIAKGYQVFCIPKFVEKWRLNACFTSFQFSQESLNMKKLIWFPWRCGKLFSSAWRKAWITWVKLFSMCQMCQSKTYSEVTGIRMQPI